MPDSIGSRGCTRLEIRQCQEGRVEATSIILLFPVIFITGNKICCVFIADSQVSVGRYAKNCTYLLGILSLIPFDEIQSLADLPF